MFIIEDRSFAGVLAAMALLAVLGWWHAASEAPDGPDDAPSAASQPTQGAAAATRVASLRATP